MAKIKPNERLVEKLTWVLTCIQEWPSYAHLEYFESWSKLKTFTAQKLKDKGASWHRQCLSGGRRPSIGSYIAIAHRFSSKRETALGLYGSEQENGKRERELAGPNETRRKVSNVAPEEIPPWLTRSKTSPFNIDRCLIYDGSEFRGKPFYYCYPVLTYRVFSNDRDQLKKRYDIDYVNHLLALLYHQHIFQRQNQVNIGADH